MWALTPLTAVICGGMVVGYFEGWNAVDSCYWAFITVYTVTCIICDLNLAGLTM